MRVIIAGSRQVTNYKALKAAIDTCPWKDKIDVVISGTARGADQLGERWARENNIPCMRFPADWRLLGKAAGPIRNAQMANVGEGLIALWDGKSRGTHNMIETAKAGGLQIHIHMVY